MPRSLNYVPKYRKHKASGQEIVTIAGKDHYLGTYGTKGSRAAYDRLIAEWIARGRSAPVDDTGFTCTELAARYWAHAKVYYRKNGKMTDHGVIRIVLREFRDMYGPTVAAEFGPLKLKAWRERLVAMGNSRRYVNDQVARLVRVFKWGVGEELIPAATYDALNSVEGLKKGRTDAKENDPIAPVDTTTVELTLPHMQPIPADMVRLQRLTGMRPSEVCQVTPGAIDRSADVWEYRPGSHKTEHHSRVRTIYIGPRAQAILLPYLLRPSDAFCFVPRESEARRRAMASEARKTPLSCGNKPGSNRQRKPKRQAGERYWPDSYRRAVHRACDKAFPAPKKLKGDDLKEWKSKHRWGPNRLRHSAGTDIRREFGLEAAQVALGHSKADTTQIYAERDAELARKVAREVG